MAYKRIKETKLGRMSFDNKNVEDIFNNGFEGFKVEPDRRVLRRIRFRLWKDEFFSLNFRKFNVLYAAVITAGLVTTPILLKKSDKDTISGIDTTINKDLPEANTKRIPEDTQSISEIVENESNKPALKAISKFAVSKAKGCTPVQISFTNESIAAESYYWDFGDGNYSRSKSPSHIYTSPGTYLASLKINNGSGVDLIHEKEISVFELPQPNFEIDIDASNISTRTVKFKNTSKNADTYKWNFGDNDKLNSGREAQHTYNAYSAYDVTLIAINEHGCSDTVSKINRFIEKDYSLYFPTNFRPNITSPNSTGMYGNESKNTSIFHPENKGVQSYTLTILDKNGTKLFETEDIKQGWNGYYKGRIARAGMYRYAAVGVYPNGKSFKIQGQFKIHVENYQNNY